MARLEPVASASSSVGLGQGHTCCAARVARCCRAAACPYLLPQVHHKVPSPLVLEMFSLRPPPLIEETPQDEEGDDEAMEPGDLIPGAGVGFIKPTKRKLAKAIAVMRVLGKGVFPKRAQVFF